MEEAVVEVLVEGGVAEEARMPFAQILAGGEARRWKALDRPGGRSYGDGVAFGTLV